jgi:tetratricopeptide (TPR) repeat protein
VAGLDWNERLSLDRWREMEPHERIVYYELILLPALRGEGLDLREARESMNLGMTYFHSHRLDEALQYLTHAVRVLEEKADDEWLAMASVDLGIVRRYRDEPDKAFRAYRQGFEIARRLSLPEVIGSSVRNITVLLDEESTDTFPIQHYSEMEEQARRFALTELACATARLHGLALLQRQQHEQAKQALTRSLRLAEELGLLHVRQELLELAEAGRYTAYIERLFTEAQGYFAAGWPRLAAAVFNKILTLPGENQVRLRHRILDACRNAGQQAIAEALAR